MKVLRLVFAVAACAGLVWVSEAVPVEQAPAAAATSSSFPPKSMNAKSKKVDLQAELFDLKNENAKLKLSLDSAAPTTAPVQAPAAPAVPALQAAAQDRERSIQDAIASEEAAVKTENEAAAEGADAENPTLQSTMGKLAEGVGAAVSDVADAATNNAVVSAEHPDTKAANDQDSHQDVAVAAAEPGADAQDQAAEATQQAGGEAGASQPAQPQVDGRPQPSPQAQVDGRPQPSPQAQPMVDAKEVDAKGTAEKAADVEVGHKAGVNEINKVKEKIVSTIDDKFGKLAKIVGINTGAMKRRAAAPQARRSTKSLVLAAMQQEEATPEVFLANCTAEGYDEACCEAVLKATFATFSIGFSYAFPSGGCPSVDVDCQALRTTLVEMGTCPAQMTIGDETVNTMMFAIAWDQIERDASASLPAECTMLSQTCEVESWTAHAENVQNSAAPSTAGSLLTAVAATIIAAFSMAL